MRTWKVWFNDSEEMKNHSVKVKATGIVPAIDEAQKAMGKKFGLKYLGWDLWKVEWIEG